MKTTLTIAMVIVAGLASAQTVGRWTGGDLTIVELPRGTISRLDGTGALDVRRAAAAGEWDAVRACGYYPIRYAVVPTNRFVLSRSYAIDGGECVESVTTIDLEEWRRQAAAAAEAERRAAERPYTNLIAVVAEMHRQRDLAREKLLDAQTRWNNGPLSGAAAATNLAAIALLQGQAQSQTLNAADAFEDAVRELTRIQGGLP